VKVDGVGVGVVVAFKKKKYGASPHTIRLEDSGGEQGCEPRGARGAARPPCPLDPLRLPARASPWISTRSDGRHPPMHPLAERELYHPGDEVQVKLDRKWNG
jgi:hypothetical protein